MSGGSYNYLFSKDAGDLGGNSHGDLEEMAKRLSELGYAEDAARETEELLLILRQARVRVQARADRLQGVWKAIEWWDSCDWTEDDVKAALKKYRGEE